MKNSSGWKSFMDEVAESAKADKLEPKQKKDKKTKHRRVDFYSTMEWRQVRYRALSLSDGCCNLCGRSKSKHNVVLHVDHVIPRSKRPELELSIGNLQVLCEDCNVGKGASCVKDWR